MKKEVKKNKNYLENKGNGVKVLIFEVECEDGDLEFFDCEDERGLVFENDVFVFLFVDLLFLLGIVGILEDVVVYFFFVYGFLRLFSF